MLRRTVTLVLFALLLLSPFSAAAQEQQLNDEKVMNAARTIFTLYLFGATGMQQGQAPDGVSYDDEGKRFSFEKVDLAGLSEIYTSATGTITREAKDRLLFNFTLTGGPVSTIKYRIAKDPNDPQGKSKPMDIKVNGSPYSFSGGSTGSE
jgi:hypothetical protein